MMQRWLLAATAFACATPTFAAPVPEATGSLPVLVARIQPIEKLLDDAKFLASKFNKPEAAKAFESQILHSMGVDSLADTGIDPKRPSGLYVFLKPTVSESVFVALVPVANEKAILEYAGKFQVKAEKLEEGLYSLAMPDLPLAVFVRFANGYAYVTPMEKSYVATSTILPPSRVFSGTETAALAITVRPELVPESLRKTALAQLVEYFKELGGPDGDEVIDFTGLQSKSLVKWIDSISEGGKEITLRVGYDRPSGELGFDFGLHAKAGSKLAAEIAAVKPGSSLFTGMVGDRGAINFAVNTRIDNEQTKDLAKVLTDAPTELVELLRIDAADARAKEAAEGFMKSLTPTIESGEFDGAISLRGPIAEKYAIMMGLRLKDGKKVEHALRALVAVLPAEQKKKIKLDAHLTDGFKLHEFETGEDNDNLKTIFEKSSVIIGFRDDAIVLGFGSNAIKAVGEALAQIAPKPAPNFQLDLSVKKIKTLFDAIAPSIFAMVEDFFGNAADRVRILFANVAIAQPPIETLGPLISTWLTAHLSPWTAQFA